MSLTSTTPATRRVRYLPPRHMMAYGHTEGVGEVIATRLGPLRPHRPEWLVEFEDGSARWVDADRCVALKQGGEGA